MATEIVVTGYPSPSSPNYWMDVRIVAPEAGKDYPETGTNS